MQYAELPAAVAAASRRSLLDTLAVAWAGATSAEDDAVRAMYLDGQRHGDATYWARGTRLSPECAAFLNGLDAAALDYDTVHHEAVIHPDIVTVPVVLALAERARASGERILLAIAAGDDLSCRLSLASSRTTQWFDTSIHGVFGAALAGGLVIGLGPQELASALALALSLASGTKQPIIEKSHSKRYQSAFAARNAVLAVRLAASGVCGVSGFFGGRAGYFSLYDNFDSQAVTADYGVRFENAGIGFKCYPSCLCNFTPIAAALRVREQPDMTADKIASVRVTISAYMNDTVGGAFSPERDPGVAGMFSVRYAVACALLRGRMTLADIRPDAVLDPVVGALARRIEIRVDAGWTGFLGPARVEVGLRDGSVHHAEIEHAPGSPRDPLDDTALLDKVRDCYRHGPRPVDARAVERLCDTVMALERMPKASGLAGWLSG